MFFKKKQDETETLAGEVGAGRAGAGKVGATEDTVVATETVVEDTIQLVEEQVAVGKKAVAGDTVRVRTEIDTAEETVSLDLRQENYTVERVAHDTVVTTVPEIRREAGVTIIPVLEERAVVVKQLVLVEEIHIREDHSVETVEETVTLRKQRAVVEREPAD